MSYRNNIIICLSLIWSLFFVSKSATAQPPPGDFWLDRALVYAQMYWDFWRDPPGVFGYNPDYGCVDPDYYEESTHFISQILQAGCAGLCENNNNNFSTPLCEPYFTGPINDCKPCPTENHSVIIEDWHYPWDPLQDWFVINYYAGSFPNTAFMFQEQVETNGLPDWIGPGTFVLIFFEDDYEDAITYPVFVGSGGLPVEESRYYAHWPDAGGRAWETLENLLDAETIDCIEIYAPGESPVTPRREELEVEREE